MNKKGFVKLCITCSLLAATESGCVQQENVLLSARSHTTNNYEVGIRVYGTSDSSLDIGLSKKLAPIRLRYDTLLLEIGSTNGALIDRGVNLVTFEIQDREIIYIQLQLFSAMIPKSSNVSPASNEPFVSADYVVLQHVVDRLTSAIVVEMGKSHENIRLRQIVKTLLISPDGATWSTEVDGKKIKVTLKLRGKVRGDLERLVGNSQ